MSNFNQSLRRHIEVMNDAFYESERPGNERAGDCKKLFEQSAEHVARLQRIRMMALGVKQ